MNSTNITIKIWFASTMNFNKTYGYLRNWDSEYVYQTHMDSINTIANNRKTIIFTIK